MILTHENCRVGTKVHHINSLSTYTVTSIRDDGCVAINDGTRFGKGFLSMGYNYIGWKIIDNDSKAELLRFRKEWGMEANKIFL